MAQDSRRVSFGRLEMHETVRTGLLFCGVATKPARACNGCWGWCVFVETMRRVWSHNHKFGTGTLWCVRGKYATVWDCPSLGLHHGSTNALLATQRGQVSSNPVYAIARVSADTAGCGGDCEWQLPQKKRAHEAPSGPGAPGGAPPFECGAIGVGSSPSPSSSPISRCKVRGIELGPGHGGGNNDDAADGWGVAGGARVSLAGVGVGPLLCTAPPLGGVCGIPESFAPLFRGGDSDASAGGGSTRGEHGVADTRARASTITDTPEGAGEGAGEGADATAEFIREHKRLAVRFQRPLLCDPETSASCQKTESGSGAGLGLGRPRKPLRRTRCRPWVEAREPTLVVDTGCSGFGPVQPGLVCVDTHPTPTPFVVEHVYVALEPWKYLAKSDTSVYAANTWNLDTLHPGSVGAVCPCVCGVFTPSPPFLSGLAASASTCTCTCTHSSERASGK